MPAIAHFQQEGERRFVIFDKVEPKGISYIDDRNKRRKISYEKLPQLWKGTTLLLEKESDFEGENYQLKHRQEVVNKWVTNGIAILLTLSLAGFLSILSAYLILPFLIFLTGMVVSVLLLRKQLGYNSSSLNTICSYGKNSSCDEVLASSGSRLLGAYSLAEISFIYFTAMTLAFLMTPIIGSLSGYFIILSGNSMRIFYLHYSLPMENNKKMVSALSFNYCIAMG